VATPSEDRELEIFNSALEFTTPAERAAYLDQSCGDDTALRAQVDELLRAHEQAGGFLAHEPASAGVDNSAADVPLGEGPGTRIGRYKLLEKIGEGGFGVVYMADQEEPVRRRVALKIIKLGMDTRAVVARFETERQALAMMDHPGIAKVHDGGATELGRPYFVMEIVRGVTITTFCDEHQVTMRNRIDLFQQVCFAVQHAHQKGVIHRDLKPSNILVTLHDDRPVPKVIDFGIAKATGQSLTDKTLFTRYHQFIGTPAYMSPEQAGAGSFDVDTRSDIYSLGVLLYELLTGQTPFDMRALRDSGYDEIQRTIREKVPAQPSNRLTSLSADELSTTAERRGLAGPELVGLLRGDLDWIVMKCLQKDRTRRYESADAVALDLGRFLDHQPVLARPDSFGYRAGKFLRRHRTPVSFAAVILVALIAGLIGTITQAQRAQRHAAAADAQRQVAEAERDRARREATKTERVSELLASLLTGADPYRTPDPNALTVRGLLDAGAARIDKELSDQPELQAEMFTVIGRVYLRLGLHDKAQPFLERALAAGRQTGAARDRMADTLIQLGVLRKERGDFASAEPLLREALELRRAHYKPGNEIAHTLVELGRVYEGWGYPDKAEPLLREALAMRRKALGEEHRDTAVSYGDLGILLMRKDDYDGAEPILREALAINRKILGDHANVAGAMNNLASVLSNKGDHAGAEALYRESIAMFRRNVGDKHWRVANVLANLGGPLREQGKHEEATAVLIEALEIERASLGREHPLVAGALALLARVWVARGDFSQAESLLREALPIQKRAYPENHPRLAMTKSLLGATLTHRQQFEEAEALLLSARDVLKGISGPEAREAKATRSRLAGLYEAWGRPEKALEYQDGTSDR